ncbi:MAG: hypothetical protein KZQ76_00435 [Candidatus Thiodiazotropha sp. (ex Epidulcina cf. delphinae)]|nr:hypothetical protein [Candidatus Thiodiazotropha sp. (ex Epidulcina cf. delphinae)]
MKTKILLKETDMPTHWYNVAADMPNPPAPILAPDGSPISPDALTAIFPEAIVLKTAVDRSIMILNY